MIGRNRMRRGGWLAMSALLAAGAMGATGAARAWDANLHGELGVAYDDNVANVRSGGPGRDDRRLQGAADLRVWLRPGPRTALVPSAGVEFAAFDRYRGLSQIRGAVQLRGLYRPGAAFLTPTLALDVGAGAVETDRRLRDGGDARVRVQVMQQLTTRLSARLSWQQQWRDGGVAVFDVSQRSAGADFDWRPGDAWSLYLGYRRIWGDLVTVAPAPSAAALAAARAVAADDVFDGDTALRLAAHGDVVTVGASRMLSPHWSLDLHLRHADAGADDLASRYRRTQSVLSVLWRY